MANDKLPSKKDAPAQDWALLSVDERIERGATEVMAHWNVAAGSVRSIGVTLVNAAFLGNERKTVDALDESNEVFDGIVRRVGALKGGPSRGTLSIAMRVVAVDRLLPQHHFWTVLPDSHKGVLVRLRDTASMSDGAEQAVKGGMSVEGLKGWVHDRLKEQGVEVVDRGATVGATRSAARKVAKVTTPKSVARISDGYRKLPKKERAATKRELQKARDAMEKLLAKLAEIDDEPDPDDE